MSMNGDYSEYDGFLADAEKDDRVGDQDLMVSEVIEDTWASGDPRVKVKGTLLTAGQAKCDFTWSPPPPASVLKEQMATMERGKKKGIASSIELAKKLSLWYGKRVTDLKAGDVVRVKCVKNKEGFIRVVAILPKTDIGKASEAVAKLSSDVPF